MKRFSSSRLLVVLLLALVAVARGEVTFDLAGPSLEVKVMRDGKTLPLAQVPNLAAGDRLWLHPDFPEEQSARYLLIVVFLRGSTNPPPDQWFVRAQTWTRQVREEGVYVMVPRDAQQALFFLAPETGGDFSTLRSNVRAKPGAFVRAAQDLNQASLDRSRLDTYLAGITEISAGDPDALKQASKVMGRSLNIKVDSDCFQKPESQQLTCLTDDQNSLVLDDGHTQSMVSTLTTGTSADLIGALSASTAVSAYSPYVGAVVDVVRIMDGIHTAQFQYIPALLSTKSEQVQLKLNNPPSFVNPKSVLTAGLPAVQPAQFPPLKLATPDQVYCIEKPGLLLPMEGAPLIYSTDLGHDFVLHVQTSKGAGLDLPARPVATRGGFVVDTHTVEVASMDPEATGILRGYWGFQPFDGPSVHLESSRQENWNLPTADRSALVVGREDTLHLQSDGAACVNDITVQDSQGKVLKANYKLIKPGELEVKVPLEDASPGAMTLLLMHAGLATPDQVKVQAYAEGARLDKFILYAGDKVGTLEGGRLDEVLKVELDGVTFSPAGLKRNGVEDELTLSADGSAANLKAGQRLTAHVQLNDGRKLDLATAIQQPRPVVALVSKNVDLGASATPSAIHLTNQDELPQDSTLSFVLQTPRNWSRTEKVEVATVDGLLSTTLTLDDGSLTLQDGKTVLARLNPLKNLGPSAFGALQFRPIDNGVEGDWQPLGNLVRIPTLKEVQCPPVADKQCSLVGSDLFLLDSVANSSSFRSSVQVPVGFANSSIAVPRPYGTLLYIKLRDDPTAINTVSLPVLPDQQQ